MNGRVLGMVWMPDSGTMANNALHFANRDSAAG